MLVKVAAEVAITHSLPTLAVELRPDLLPMGWCSSLREPGGRPPSKSCPFLREAGRVSWEPGAGGSPRAMKHTLGTPVTQGQGGLWSRALCPGRRCGLCLAPSMLFCYHLSPAGPAFPAPPGAGRVWASSPAAHLDGGTFSLSPRATWLSGGGTDCGVALGALGQGLPRGVVRCDGALGRASACASLTGGWEDAVPLLSVAPVSVSAREGRLAAQGLCGPRPREAAATRAISAGVVDCELGSL